MATEKLYKQPVGPGVRGLANLSPPMTVEPHLIRSYPSQMEIYQMKNLNKNNKNPRP